jgi:hypothetical protein
MICDILAQTETGPVFPSLAGLFGEILSKFGAPTAAAPCYIIEDGKPVVCPDLLKWAQWMANPSNCPARKTKRGQVQVSTCFIGIGKPGELFETRVFGGPFAGRLERAGSWKEAARNHYAMCRLVWTKGVAK